MSDYNARIEWDVRHDPKTEADADLIERLADYHPAVSRGVMGHLEAFITLPADTLRQATTTALSIAESARPEPVLVVEVMPTDEFDRRVSEDAPPPVPALMSVTQAAERLDVSVQGLRKSIASGATPATRVGNAHVLTVADVERIVAAKKERKKGVTSEQGEAIARRGQA